ncbi:GNAT family N-acetyltransferase [Jannaschia sp. Os4]|uniref:GNAT family N-acetyltransferase n=1 Tax=Jannaschia sp. Os4 TaxID=2807617 RepID=UPI0019393CFC|nr:GNAT family N-acetyltransferase [Jannaschia sp. Os4]MBM2576432.1 GNAT family N-acetyltransferase [Jannaschia sp. Os4]
MLTEGYHAVPSGHVAAVVTHLEMAAPAALPEVPASEAEVVAWAPSVEAYLDLFRAVGGPWLWASALFRDASEISDIIDDSRYETFMLRCGEGRGILDLDFRTEGACELAYFGLTPDLAGRGLGKVLMAHAVRRAFRDGPLRFHVHTCTLDGPNALQFYRRMGFVATKREVEIMRDPRGTVLPEDAAPQVPRL